MDKNSLNSRKSPLKNLHKVSDFPLDIHCTYKWWIHMKFFFHNNNNMSQPSKRSSERGKEKNLSHAKNAISTGKRIEQQNKEKERASNISVWSDERYDMIRDSSHCSASTTKSSLIFSLLSSDNLYELKPLVWSLHHTMEYICAFSWWVQMSFFAAVHFPHYARVRFMR